MFANSYFKFGMVALVLFSVILYWANHNYGWFTPEKTNSSTSVLSQALDSCESIADKSVANMTVMVEFQKLEIAGRRVRVLQNCMNDHGFIENPAWVKFTQPLAQTAAQANQISASEAYENLRRADMARATANGTPLYWLAKPAN